MFAIIKTGGKQYIVRPGDKIKVEKLDASEGKEVVFSDVLLVSDKGLHIGAPYVKGYKVKGKVLGQGKAKKIIVYKYKAKKRYHKKQGHRQLYTEVEILSIAAPKGGPASPRRRRGERASPSVAGRGSGIAKKKPVPKRSVKRPVIKSKPVAKIKKPAIKNKTETKASK